MLRCYAVSIHPTFYLVILWFLICGGIVEFAIFSIVLAIHEFGHYYVSKKQGYTLEKFYIAPYGACLNYKEKQFERRDEIKIAMAGPIVNLICAFLFIALWWVFPQTYVYSLSFVEESLFLALFNLIPAYPLDGGRVLVAISSHKRGREKAVKKAKIFNLTFSIIFFSLFVISWFYSFNPTFALATVFMLSGMLEGEFGAKYKNSFLFKKRVPPFSKSRHLVVPENLFFKDLLKKIDGDCYTIFEVLSEKGEIIFLTETQVINYCVKFGGGERLDCLFDKI